MGAAFTVWECSAPITNDSDSKSCAFWLGPTAVSRLKELLRVAYAIELDQYLLDLSNKFDDWKNKKITCWDLNDHLREFHDGISRDLFNAYNARGVDDIYMISRAVIKKLLQKEDIPSEAVEIVERCANFFEQE